jgi:hypothetical protein
MKSNGNKTPVKESEKGFRHLRCFRAKTGLSGLMERKLSKRRREAGRSSEKITFVPFNDKESLCPE